MAVKAVVPAPAVAIPPRLKSPGPAPAISDEEVGDLAAMLLEGQESLISPRLHETQSAARKAAEALRRRLNHREPSLWPTIRVWWEDDPRHEGRAQYIGWRWGLKRG